MVSTQENGIQILCELVFLWKTTHSSSWPQIKIVLMYYVRCVRYVNFGCKNLRFSLTISCHSCVTCAFEINKCFSIIFIIVVYFQHPQDEMVTYAGSVVNFGTENGATVKEENDVNENGARQKRSQVHITNTLIKNILAKFIQIIFY